MFSSVCNRKGPHRTRDFKEILLFFFFFFPQALASRWCFSYRPLFLTHGMNQLNRLFWFLRLLILNQTKRFSQLVTAVSYFRTSNPRESFDFKISFCFFIKQPIKTNSEFENMSSEPSVCLVPRLREPREAKRAAETRMWEVETNDYPCEPETFWIAWLRLVALEIPLWRYTTTF